MLNQVRDLAAAVIVFCGVFYLVMRELRAAHRLYLRRKNGLH